MTSVAQLLQFDEAVQAFGLMPSAHQMASLHPRMVEIDALKDRALRPTYWQYVEGDARLLRFFHITDNRDLGVKDIQSAYGYGGPLSNCDDAAFVESAGRAFGEWARANGILAEFLRFHPLVPHESWYSGQVSANRSTVCMDLAGDLVRGYLGRRRRNVRRFKESGLAAKKVSAEAMRTIFPGLYASNMQAIGAAGEYLFPAAYFEALLDFQQVDSWLVESGGEVVAGAIVLKSPEARTLEYHLGARSAEADQHQAMAGLLHAIALHYRERNYDRFYLGGGRSTKPDDSLLFFKEGFSRADRVFRTASVIYDMPRYEELARLLPKKAASGRVLFYKD